MEQSLLDPGRLKAMSGAAKSRRDLLCDLVASFGARSVLELGVWEGGTSAEVLRRCPGVKTYWMLDPWRPLPNWNKPSNVSEARFEQVHAAAMRATDFAADRRRVLRGTTIEQIDVIPDGSLDLAYVDGDHTLRGITIDLLLVLKKMRPGGLVMGDDFCPDIWQHDRLYEPTLVFPFAVHLAEAYGMPIFALGHDQFLLEVRCPGNFAFVDLDGRYGGQSLLDQINRRPSYAATGVNALSRRLRKVGRSVRRRLPR